MPIKLHDDETKDDLLHGELKLIQNRRGYRYSVDALLLAHFALPVVAGEDVLDMGTGAGVVALILAARGGVSRMVGVEVQQGLCGLAERNAAINHTDPPVEIVRADALDLSRELGESCFGVVVTNPPFRPVGAGNLSPDPEKAVARHEVMMSIKSWLREAMRLIRDDGKIILVYPVDQEDRLWRTAEELGLFVARRRYATHRPGGDRKLALAEFRTGPCQTKEEDDIPIETDEGKFSLDGYK